MTESLVIAPRFCGPPGTGNGGYVCGRVAAYLDRPAIVTLRLPPPLARPMAVEQDHSDSVRVLDGRTLVAEATGLPHSLAMELPSPVSLPEARAAGSRSRLRARPDEHPFPTCFVCGPDRIPGDGLRILVAPVAGRELSADVWYPDEALAGPDGCLRPGFLWAALDCPGGIGAMGDIAPDGLPFVLGQLSVRQLGPVSTSEPYVVIGWRLSGEGRKILAGSALFTADGQAVGVARGTWIRLR